MAAKNVIVYSVDELVTLDRKDLLQFQENIVEALGQSQQDAMNSLKQMLEDSGLDANEFAKFIGAKVAATPAATGSGSSTRAKGDDPELNEFKARHKGKTVIDPVTGKKYTFGGRGPMPSFVRQNMAAIDKGNFDFEDDSAPGEVKPADVAE